MDKFIGKYRLVNTDLEHSDHIFKLEVEAVGQKDTNNISGEFVVEEIEQHFSIFIFESAVQLRSVGLESSSILMLPLDGSAGEGHVHTFNIDKALSFTIKLLSYEYNNTHFMIEYIRFFGEKPEMKSKIEVTFDVKN